MISLRSDELMLFASTLLESWLCLVVTLLEPLTQHWPRSQDCRRVCRANAQRCVFTLWSIYSYWLNFGVPWGWFHTAEGVLTPPFKGYRPIICIHRLQRVEPSWLRIYNWSTAWPITFKEIISFGKYYVRLGHVLLIALVNFNVSSLHPKRKGR